MSAKTIAWVLTIGVVGAAGPGCSPPTFECVPCEGAVPDLTEQCEPSEGIDVVPRVVNTSGDGGTLTGLCMVERVRTKGATTTLDLDCPLAAKQIEIVGSDEIEWTRLEGLQFDVALDERLTSFFALRTPGGKLVAGGTQEGLVPWEDEGTDEEFFAPLALSVRELGCPWSPGVCAEREARGALEVRESGEPIGRVVAGTSRLTRGDDRYRVSVGAAPVADPTGDGYECEGPGGPYASFTFMLECCG